MMVRLGILATLFVVGGVLGAALVYPGHEDPPPYGTNAAEVTAYWSSRIEREGGDAAYRAFSLWASAAGPGTQHLLAHLMGGALYRTLGVDGLSVCDSSFSFGCFHEFLGQAIHAGGLGSIGELSDACSTGLGSQGLSCQHGIGHGIQTALGYEEDDLREALSRCRTLPGDDSAVGCAGGVFMEYNMRTMLSLDGVGLREGGEDVYAPCGSVDAAFAPACYYWQPQWWVASRSVPLADAYADAGARCRALDDAFLAQKCFEGIGGLVGQDTEYVAADAIALCDRAAGGNTDAALFCRSEAANSFFAAHHQAERAAALCEGFAGDDRLYCLRHSDNTFNQFSRPAQERGLVR